MNEITHALIREYLHELNSFEIPHLTREVEEKFCSDWGLKYVLLQNSGTNALLSCYYACGFKSGDEVLVQSYGFFATAMPLFFLGCKIIFVDSDENGNISVKDLQRKISRKTKAVVVTHLWGIPCKLNEIMKIINETGALLIEDCSHSHGAKYNGIVVGNFGAASAWSLGARKNITGGQGGLFSTKNRLFYERARLLGHANDKVMGDIKLPEHLPFIITGMGLNLRIHPFSALMIKIQLESHETKVLPRKREIANFFRSELSNVEGIDIPYIPENADPAWYAFPVLFNRDYFSIDKQEFIDVVNENCGQSLIDAPYSTRPISSFPIFESKCEFPGAMDYHEKVFKFSVPSDDNRMTVASRIVDSIKKVSSLYRR